MGLSSIQPSRGAPTILIAEDEEEVRSYIELALRCCGYRVELAENGEEVMQLLHEPRTDISAVLLDIIMPRKDGIETLHEIRRLNRDLPIIMLSGESSPSRVMEAVRGGANDFLGKPVTHEDLNRAIEKALIGRPLHSTLQAEASQPPPARAAYFAGFGTPKWMDLPLTQIGASELPVLIQGETGTGKEVLARQLHANSPRAGKPFIKLNCAALPPELVESELFGYERGAFTGAHQKKPGIFEVADGGTILLDEIGDMDFRLQAKLLQVLQDQEFQRIGGRETIRVNIRVLAATHRNLEEAIGNSTFREDLYYRLNVITLRVPSLRERKEEIVPLAQFLLTKHAGSTPPPVITPELRRCLLDHDWPGNVRELENTIRKFIVIRNPQMVADDLLHRTRSRSAAPVTVHRPVTPPAPIESASVSPPQVSGPVLAEVGRAKERAETELIMNALHTTRWNRKRAAKLLNIDYKALLYKMKKLSIDDEDSVAVME